MKCRPVTIAVALLSVLPLLSWAQPMDTHDGPSTGLSAQLTCQLVGVFQSNVGLMAGLTMAVWGLWTLLRTGKIKSAIILIISGALLTALPTLVTSFFSGMSGFLTQVGISDVDITSPMNYAVKKAGSCDSIEVDYSNYDPSQPQYWQPGGGSQLGVPGGLSGSKSGPVFGSRPVDVSSIPAADEGASASGCASLVKGGSTPRSGYGPRVHPVTKERGRMHWGVDLAAPSGREILSAGAGTVVYAGWAGGAGNMVQIDHGNGTRTNYFHMSSVGVSVNKSVGQGETIGYVGSTGQSTGPHLHFEVIQNGTKVNPATSGMCGGGGGGSGGVGSA